MRDDEAGLRSRDVDLEEERLSTHRAEAQSARRIAAPLACGSRIPLVSGRERWRRWWASSASLQCRPSTGARARASEPGGLGIHSIVNL